MVGRTTADSLGNLVAANRLAWLGEQTKDLGAISLIGYSGGPLTGSVIRDNCVRDVVGVYSGDDGVLHVGYYTWGIYLDNEANGYLVARNVVARAVCAGAFVHLGRGNSIVNNVFVNMTNADGNGGQLAVEGKTSGDITRNNSWARNVVAFARTSTECLIYDAGGSSNFLARYLDRAQTHQNLYYPSGEGAAALVNGEPPAWLLNSTVLTPLGNWSNWRAAGYDAGAAFADPRFVDAARGDFCIEPSSPAFGLIGFEELSPRACQCGEDLLWCPPSLRPSLRKLGPQTPHCERRRARSPRVALGSPPRPPVSFYARVVVVHRCNLVIYLFLSKSSCASLLGVFALGRAGAAAAPLPGWCGPVRERAHGGIFLLFMPGDRHGELD